MPKYLTQPAVEQDLLEIAEFIAKENPEAAIRVLNAVDRTFQLLAVTLALAVPETLGLRTYAVHAADR